jgi:hypothetical protein
VGQSVLHRLTLWIEHCFLWRDNDLSFHVSGKLAGDKPARLSLNQATGCRKEIWKMLRRSRQISSIGGP